MNKIALWAVTVVVAGLLASPSVIGLWAGGDAVARPAQGAESARERPAAAAAGRRRQVTLAIQNMTCAGCVATLNRALENVDGVADARVTLKPPRAVVTFDPSRTSITRLVHSTASVGYPSTPINKAGD